MVKDLTNIELEVIDIAKKYSCINLSILDSPETPLLRKIILRHLSGNKKNLELCSYKSGDIKLFDSNLKMIYHYNKENRSWDSESDGNWRLTADFIDQFIEEKTEPRSAVYENIKEWVRIISSDMFQPPPSQIGKGLNPNDTIVYRTSFIRNNNMLSIEYERDHSVYLNDHKNKNRIQVTESREISNDLKKIIFESLK